jgi:hypothetical protein
VKHFSPKTQREGIILAVNQACLDLGQLNVQS